MNWRIKKIKQLDKEIGLITKNYVTLKTWKKSQVYQIKEYKFLVKNYLKL